MTTHPYQDFLTEALPRARAHRGWTEADGALPAAYLSHGAPPLLESRTWMDELFTWSTALPKPRNILIVSAHWESAPLAVSQSAANTPLVYDFSGFDPLYNRLTYPTPDATALADRVVSAMPDGETVHRHPRRGLDHGAWVPLMVMYPAADVPVLQLSMPTHDPKRLLDLGSRLRPLREEGTLVIGSGFMTHGLPFLSYEQFLGTAPAPSWSSDFDAWAAQALRGGDLDELAAFADKAPGMPYAHPTVEHYVPMFVALGAADRGAEAVTTTVEGYFFGLSKRSFEAA